MPNTLVRYLINLVAALLVVVALSIACDKLPIPNPFGGGGGSPTPQAPYPAGTQSVVPTPAYTPYPIGSPAPLPTPTSESYPSPTARP